MSNISTRHDNRGRRRFAGLAIMAAVVTMLGGLLPSAATAEAQTIVQTASTEETEAAGEALGVQGLWQEPINLSNSGSASSPRIAAEPDGTLHALWWDKFDGTKYRYTRSDGTWSNAVNVPVIVGLRQRSATGVTSISPPIDLVVVADTSGLVHALWRNAFGDLMYSRVQSGTTAWSAALRLAIAPLAWDVYVAPEDGTLNLAFIRSTTTGTVDPGVYFRRLRGRSNWTEPTLIVESLYFRTLPESEASISVAADGGRTVWVAWDDPVLKRSFLAKSINSGGAFGDPEMVEPGDIIEAAVPKRMRLIALPGDGGEFIRLWEAGDSCILYQQQTTADGLWSEPIRVLDRISACARGQRVYQGDDTRIYLVVGEKSGQSALLAWDGAVWTQPTAPQPGFVDVSTNDLIVLNCLNSSISQISVVVVGCDSKGDVWALVSSKLPSQYLPLASGAWKAPVILSESSGDAGLPAVATDLEGRFHLMWSQMPPPGSLGTSLAYMRGDGSEWSDISAIIRASSGQIGLPSLLTDASGVLHALWSSGTAGRILYSSAFARDALVPNDWAEPQALPALRDLGDAPSLAIGPSGRLYAAYAIPFNESRGVYYTYSGDLGSTWSEPVSVFNAEANGWTVVRQVVLVVDAQETLHVAWVRAALPDLDSPLGVYYARSTDGGSSWSQPLEFDPGANAHPVMVAGPDNQLHFVWAKQTLSGYELWHRWSPDGGSNWSLPQRISGLGFIAPDVGLVADRSGLIHLAGVEATDEGTASIFYLTWNGANWVEQEGMALGYDFVDGLGARLAISSTGTLSVFCRMRVPTIGGVSHYVILQVTRQLETVAEVVAAPTFTPRPNATGAVPATVLPTLTPVLTPAPASNAPSLAANSTTLWQVGGLAAAMLLVSIVAVVKLWGRIQR